MLVSQVDQDGKCALRRADDDILHRLRYRQRVLKDSTTRSRFFRYGDDYTVIVNYHGVDAPYPHEGTNSFSLKMATSITRERFGWMV